MAIKTGTGDDDIIIGTDGNDLIFGFGGDDDIVAGDGADVVYGGSGDDAIDGGQGNDALFGGSGNDVLFGGDGNDLILGGSGDDTIDAGAGNNIVTGGTGDDRFIFESGSGQLLITDFHAGPGSSDLIVLRNFEVSTLSGLLALAHDIGGSTVIDFNNGDRLILAGVNKADLLADDFAFETMGTGGSDIITGTSSDDVIDAGGGDDEIIYTVGGGFDVVDGGEGTDDFVLQGIDTAQTGVLVEDGATYAARTGDLTVAPDHIAISVNGQLAADLDNIEDLVFNAGALGDTIDVSGDFSGTDLAPETIRVVGGAKKDAVRLSPVLTSTKKVALIVEAGGGDDEVKAASGRDVLAGEDGNDVLIGGSGNDLLIGGAGNDTLDGGDDYDIAIFGSPSATYRTPLDSVLGYDITIGAETGAATIVDTDPSNGDDGTDELAGIEEVRFGDLTLFLDGLNNSPFIGAAQLSGSIAELPDGDPNENQFTHSTQGTIEFREFDRTLGHTVTAAPNGVDYRGELTVEFSDSDTSDGAGQINWTFSVDDAALDDLADGQVLFQTYDVTINDGNGGSATATVTVRIDGASDAANAPPVAVGELMATDEETVLSGRNLLADNGSGADYDPDLTDTFTINTINGSSANVGQQITLSSGALLTVQANGDLVFDPRGAFDFVPEGSGSADNFTYTLIDQNGAVSNEALVNLSVIGVNDAPVAVGELMATDEETVLSGRNLFADNGSGADYDPDLTDTFTINTINGSSANVGQQITLSSGALLTVQANGDLVFDPRGAFDFVPEGSGSADNFTYTLIDQNGAVSNEALVNLSVIGVNDPPVVSGAASGDRDVIEDSDSSAAGALTITDADLGEDRFQPVAVAAPSAGEFGTYTVTAAGAWAYTLDNANPTVQALVAGEVLADSFDVVSFDGTVTATVDITITGTDEGIVLQPSYNIADIIAGTADLNGFVINGIDANDLSGQSVSSAGDVNGDGIDDLIIGAPGADPAEIGTPGQAYVVFGTQSGFSSSIELSALNGTNGFAINGVAQNGQIGLSVSGAGDINDDGLDDLIVSSQNAGSYLVYGSNTGFGANGVLDLALLDGTNGVSIGAGSSILSSVSEAGDVNGDGIDDLVIGSPTTDPGLQVDAGESYVVFGSASGLGIGGIFDLNTLDGTNGFVLIGPDARDRSGESVSAAGDVNGDGIDDLIIGATGADPNGDSFAGESYVVFGSTSGFGINGVLDLSTLNGTNGFVVNGIDPSDASGTSVSGAGDINGDGIDDIVIGAEGASGSRGESYVVFGSASGIGTNGVLELDGLDGTNGFLIVDSNLGGGESLGHSVSVVGDINSDGYDDLIIGSNQASPNGDTGAGQSYVLFGSAEEFGISGVLDLATLDGTNGFVMNGIDVDDGSGFSVSGAGDVNGDGFDDLLVAAFQADPNGSASGESYVIFGGDFFI
ncbi:MAG: beta strand repeat-containing protein [Hyphomicrobiaceae bacterium]